MPQTSGKFVLRLNPALHQDLKRLAAAAGVSLNEYCFRRLAAESKEAAMRFDSGLEEAIQAARALYQDDLAALVLYGSWVRGTATRGSDVDLLVVLSSGTPIRRQMYRAWDELSLSVDGHKVEPAIVALPEATSPVSGFWAEVATQGVLCWWRDLSAHQYLVSVRERIAAGELRRERSHGQSYWVHRTEVA